jgi:hypothetical protein
MNRNIAGRGRSTPACSLVSERDYFFPGRTRAIALIIPDRKIRNVSGRKYLNDLAFQHLSIEITEASRIINKTAAADI